VRTDEPEELLVWGMEADLLNFAHRQHILHSRMTFHLLRLQDKMDTLIIHCTNYRNRSLGTIMSVNEEGGHGAMM
jgi:hypothetical protein